MKKLGIIGLGKMGDAILQGVMKKNLLKTDGILLYVRNPQKVTMYEASGFSCADLQTVFEQTSILILAIKPQNFPDFFQSVASFSRTGVVVSIAAGISLRCLNQQWASVPCVRVMPNTPAMIGKGVSAISRNGNVKDADYKDVKSIFETLGSCVDVEEKWMDAIVPLNGSMPAFLDRFVLDFMDAAVARGIPETLARALVVDSIAGACSLIQKSDRPVSDLLRDVCSPKGTTLAGIEAMDAHGFRGAVKACYEACATRSEELRTQAESRP